MTASNRRPMTPYNLRVYVDLLERFDAAVKQVGGESRSSAVRAALELWIDTNAPNFSAPEQAAESEGE